MTGLKNSVPVAEAEDVADHGHDGEGAREVGPAVEPHLGRGSLQQQNLGQVVTVSIFQRMFKHLHLVHQREVLRVGRHPLHYSVLDIEEDLLLLPAIGGPRGFSRQKMNYSACRLTV